MTIAELGLSVDLVAEPSRYPGPFLPFSCLQLDDRLLALDGADPLGEWRRRTHAEPHFVVGIGSNSSPDVVRRKLIRLGASTTVLHLLGTLDGVALGHSAHVSPPGYVPATPYERPGVTSDVVVSVLTGEQLSCLDATEPNYDRVTVARDRVTTHPDVALPAEIFLYRSKRGLLVAEDGEPVPFMSQPDLFRWLGDRGVAGSRERISATLAERHSLSY